MSRLATTTHNGVDTSPLFLWDIPLSPERSAMIDQHRKSCLGIAFKYCRYNVLPEDLKAEAYLFMVWVAQRWDPSRGVKFVTYFGNSWRKRMGDLFRQGIKQKRRSTRQFALAGDGHTIGEEESVDAKILPPDQELEREETLGVLRGIMCGLPPNDRQVCEMHFDEGKRFADIAREMGRGHEVTRQAIRRFVSLAQGRLGVPEA